MALDRALLERAQPASLTILRVVTAYLFMLHGSAKLFGVPHQSMFDNLQLMSIIGLAGILEFFGGLLILVGFFTRPAAFVLCGFMAVAYFMAHASQGNPLLPILNQGDLAVLFCFVFLYFVFAGAGPWSMDALLARRRGSPRA